MVSSIVGGVLISALRMFANKGILFNNLGMNLAHLGIAVTIFGIGVVSSPRVQRSNFRNWRKYDFK